MAIDQKPASPRASRLIHQKSLEPTSSWKPLVFVDLRVPCLEYSAAAEIDMLRMSDDDQVAIDDLISLLERFHGTPSAPDLGIHDAVSTEKLPVYRMQLQLAQQELEKRNALLEKAQARHKEDMELQRQMREAFMKEIDSLRNQLSVQRRDPTFRASSVEYMPSDGRRSQNPADLESELDFWQSRSDEMNARIRALEAQLKKSQGQVTDLLRKLKGYSGAELAAWLRDECGLTDERAAELIVALGGAEGVLEMPNHHLEDESRSEQKVYVERKKSFHDASDSHSVTAKNEEVTRLRRMLDNVVRFDRAGRLGKAPAQQREKGWTRHEVDIGQLAKAPDEYVRVVNDNQDFLDNFSTWKTNALDDTEFLQKAARHRCFSYPPPLLDSKDHVIWPDIDPKALMKYLQAEMMHSAQSSSSEEDLPRKRSVRKSSKEMNSDSTSKPPRPGAEGNQSSSSEMASSEMRRKSSMKSSKEDVPVEDELVSDAESQNHEHLRNSVCDIPVGQKTLPTRCPYCGRDLNEPPSFNYKPWRYQRSESGFKRPEDINVAAFVCAALMRRGKVKVFDRLFYQRFNEPWQRKRAPQSSTSQARLQSCSASHEASVDPDLDRTQDSSLLQTTMMTVTTAAETEPVSMGAGTAASTKAPTTLASTTASLGPLHTIDLTFGSSVQNSNQRRNVWEFVEYDPEGVPPSGLSRSSHDRAFSGTSKRAENTNGPELASASTPVPILDERWKPLAPLQLNKERSKQLKPIQISRPARSAGHCRQPQPTPDERRTEESRNMLQALWQQRRALDCAPEDLDRSTSPRVATGAAHAALSGGNTIRSVLEGRVPKKVLPRCGSAPNFHKRASRG